MRVNLGGGLAGKGLFGGSDGLSEGVLEWSNLSGGGSLMEGSLAGGDGGLVSRKGFPSCVFSPTCFSSCSCSNLSSSSSISWPSLIACWLPRDEVCCGCKERLGVVRRHCPAETMVYPGQQGVVGWERRADEGQGGGARWGVKREQHGAGLGWETRRGSWVASRAWTSTASRVTMWCGWSAAGWCVHGRRGLSSRQRSSRTPYNGLEWH